VVEGRDEDLIFLEQKVTNEAVEGVTRIDDRLPAHAVAGIEQHPQTDRHTLVGKLRDCLLDAVFENLKVALCKSGDESASAVGHRHGDLDDIHAAAERRGLAPHDGATHDTACCDCASSVVIHGPIR
jgi:hypothetical protein